ncbi:MAG: MerR family transcriptional regulator [Actinomycetota bacterium]
MRISELSERTGVSIPTIKFYIREGLLPRGEPTGSNRATYSSHHAGRLALIRTLREVAHLPVATIGEVLSALDEPAAAARGEHVALALGSLARQDRTPTASAASMVASLADRMGWVVDPASGSYRDLAAALTALEEHWGDAFTLDGLERYARIAQELAEMEIPAHWQPADADSLTYAVLGTILYEPVILALRRMAHADRHRRLTRPEGGEDS